METGWRRNYLRYKSFFLNMMTQYKERSDWKAYLEILLSLATISVFSIFALRPTILTIAELITRNEEKQKTLATMDEKIENLGRAQTLFDRESAGIRLLTDSGVPKSPNSDIVARQIEGLVSKHQIPVKTFTLGEALIFGNVAEVPTKEENEEAVTQEAIMSNEYEFNLLAPLSIDQFDLAKSFISDFEHLRMPPVIQSLEVGLDDEKGINRALILQIEGKLLYLVEPNSTNF